MIPLFIYFVPLQPDGNTLVTYPIPHLYILHQRHDRRKPPLPSVTEKPTKSCDTSCPSRFRVNLSPQAQT